MSQSAAKQNDQVTATDTHIVIVPGSPPTPTPLPHPFTGVLDKELSDNVNVMGFPAATVGSIATNTPSHIPTPPGTSFQTPPKNRGVIKLGSQTVFVNGKGAARNGDVVDTCNDPFDQPVGTVIASGSVFIGG
jgi:uncharacterized Zn-binding protein involved in type VI secretion